MNIAIYTLSLLSHNHPRSLFMQNTSCTFKFGTSLFFFTLNFTKHPMKQLNYRSIFSAVTAGASKTLRHQATATALQLDISRLWLAAIIPPPATCPSFSCHINPPFVIPDSSTLFPFWVYFLKGPAVKSCTG